MTTTLPTSSNVQQTVMGAESTNLADEFMKQLQNVNTIAAPRHGNRNFYVSSLAFLGIQKQ